ncbi:piggyBac transposable element-derived protein 4-like [Portunus trituberculatus]|uniref:piggyBac transposable element-derived protein 4-like n=1 Tax=Portunus trituberculatus TaxID=210409 RepID=UPI001E1CFA5A|nr:piggyBac transposable element-derived protein 4-like [Portunus trituberculatus]
MSRRRRLRDEEIPCQLVEIPSDPESDVSDGDDDDDAAFLQEEEVAEYESCDENGDADDDEEEEEEEFRNQNSSPDVNCSSSEKIMWRKTYCPAPAGEFTSSTGPSQEIFDLEDPTPHDICSKFITKEVIEDIVFQTNLYALQQGKNYKPTDENEIKTFIGMNLLMGIVKLPSYRDYWSSNPCLHNDFISKLMPVNRFGWLLGNSHLNDNTLMPDRKSPEYDKLYKVRPFLKAMQENFERHFLPSCSVAVDESMIKFKGRSSMKQYQPNKPIKRGYKVWMMADKSGYCLKFDIYTGKVENKVTKDLGAKVVTSLVEDLEGKEHKVYFDNYFTSVDLMKKLKEKGVNACGTVKPSRRNLPTFKSSKNMSRGDSETFTSNTGINATKWRDKKDVFLLTNFHDPKDISEVARREKDGTRKLYPCPISIIEYNKNMNSVDKFDQLLFQWKYEEKNPVINHSEALADGVLSAAQKPKKYALTGSALCAKCLFVLGKCISNRCKHSSGRHVLYIVKTTDTVMATMLQLINNATMYKVLNAALNIAY